MNDAVLVGATALIGSILTPIVVFLWSLATARGRMLTEEVTRLGSEVAALKTRRDGS